MKAASSPYSQVLALVSLLGSTAVALAMVPRASWMQLHEPSVRAVVLMLVVLILVLALRRGGASGARKERLLLCLFLASMPLVYLESGLRPQAGSWLLVEVAGLLLFASWAWLAYRHDAGWLALGLAAHGLGWDTWHHGSLSIPSWYTHACLVVDLGLALYVLLERDRLSLAGPPHEAAPARPEPTPAAPLDAQATAIRVEMWRELATTFGTLERRYQALRSATQGADTDRQSHHEASLPDVRTVLMRLRLVVPSLAAGRAVMPDMAQQRQQTEQAKEQAVREREELGIALAIDHHIELFRHALETVLAASKQTLGAGAGQRALASALDALTAQLDQAHHATHVLQLTLAAAKAQDVG